MLFFSVLVILKAFISIIEKKYVLWNILAISLVIIVLIKTGVTIYGT